MFGSTSYLLAVTSPLVFAMRCSTCFYVDNFRTNDKTRWMRSGWGDYKEFVYCQICWQQFRAAQREDSLVAYYKQQIRSSGAVCAAEESSGVNPAGPALTVAVANAQIPQLRVAVAMNVCKRPSSLQKAVVEMKAPAAKHPRKRPAGHKTLKAATAMLAKK